MSRIPAVAIALLLGIGLASPTPVRGTDPPPAQPPAGGAVVTRDGRVLPAMPAGMEEQSVHAEMLAQHADDPLRFKPGRAPSVVLGDSGDPQVAGNAATPGGTLSTSALATAAGLPNGLRKEVFGFLPYWMLTDSALASLNYHLVSTIAYFSVNAQANGLLSKGTSTSPTTGWSGWNSSAMTSVLNRAHAEGVRVVLTVTMMAWDSASAGRQATLLQSPTARSQLVSQIVSALRARRADGVNLDFEPLSSSLRDEYVSFVKQLKRGLVNAGVGSYLTVSVMASAATWATGYDVAGLTGTGGADALFVMGYDYNWSGSSRAGGVAPIQSPYTIDVAGTMADFLTQTSGSKIIWGVPYYGRTWPTASPDLNARTLGGGSKAYSYSGHLAQATQYGRRWDDVGKVPWYRHWDATASRWVQGYYDDVQSLGVKYDLVNSRGLKGTGMWTLLMDQGRDELWRLLARKFVTDTAPPVGGITLLPSSLDSQAVRVSWRAQDYASGVARYYVQWRVRGQAWHAWLNGTKATAAWFTGSAGTLYEFRVRAIDLAGNAQPWLTAVSKPSSLQPATFGRVIASTLNVRSGPGTGYGIVGTATAGDIVHVIEGPVSAGGYEWHRVQYGFTEWPSAEYPLIAWMAGSSAGTPMIAPAQAPTVTRLAPFVTQGVRTPAFSPNGDGVQDSGTISFSLREPTTATRLDILDSGGTVVRSVDLGSRAGGLNQASWDGRLQSGDVAADGRYLARITATDGISAQHAGPTSTFSLAALRKWGIVVDRTRSGVGVAPANGTEMVPATAAITLRFSEAMLGLDAGPVAVSTGGTSLAVDSIPAPDRRSVTVTTGSVLPSNSTISVHLDPGVRDAAGNPPARSTWSFLTAPGSAYRPTRGGILAAGSPAGYVVAQDGRLLGRRIALLPSAQVVSIAQRASVPNLPGYWLYVQRGPLAGRWVRETPKQRINGMVSRVVYGAAQGLVLQAGTHVGYRFRPDGEVWLSRTITLARRGTAASSLRAVINGITYWRIRGGALDGYWIRQSAGTHQRGKQDERTFAIAPTIEVAPGTHTAFGYDWLGRVTRSLTAHVGSTALVRVSAWAVINGMPHFLVSTGPWTGYWLPESSLTRLHV